MGSILAIDYGLKRIGIAVSDPSRIFAFPHSVIENKSLDHVLASLKKIVFEKEVDLIIVGVPFFKNPDVRIKDDNEMQKLINAFVTKLKVALNIQIEVVDESLSSFSANENLKEIGISAKKSKDFIDKEAARIMLEEFLKKS